MKRITKRFTTVLLLFFVLVYDLSTYFYTFSEYVSKITSTETGINGNIVTINDLKSDYYYYMAQNYTTNDGTLPTTSDKQIYSTNNLVETKITYYGYDIENKNHAYVSLTEQQDTYIYYKIYPINNNGTNSLTDDYIEIELIDNPFTDRPNNMGFNGWLTDYLNAEITFDKNYYIRKAKIPVTYIDNTPETLDIKFYSTWIEAKVAYLNSQNNNWSNAFSMLDEDQMQAIGGEKPVYENVAGLYTQGSVSGLTNYPAGAVNERGQNQTGRCNNWFGSCTYYLEVEEGQEYDSSVTYYKLTGNGNNASMNAYEVQIIDYEILPMLEENTILAGYFKKVTLNRGNSLEGLYSLDGTLQKNTTCNQNTCEYYKLISYYDEDNNILKADGNTIYYYLATRDTNIIVMATNISSKWSSDENKPFTLTSIYNKTNYTSNVTWTVSNQYITCYNDTVIENIKINSQSSNSSNDPSSNATTTRNLYANYNNVKIGRGIIRNNNYKTFNHVFGGNNATDAIGSSSNTVKYRLTVESGFYNTITLANGPSNTNRDKYIEAQAIYGNDYDRITQNNSNLDVYFLAAGSWGAGNYYAPTSTGIVFDTNIKSGQFGTGKYDHTTGVYVGGRSYGTFNSARRIKVEGGWIYNLIGGPLTASNRGDLNDIYIYMTGGSIDMIIGGAGTSTTYGNRIIQLTGGTVNYSVFGGSNSYEGGSSDGKLTGSSYVYVGGTAQIGNETYASNATLWGAETGSVFGIGNGNTSANTIGTNENSNIIIADECNILGNVYGGGNYSATGIGSRSSTTKTNIKIIGGTINGNVYGGGNKNGSGSNSISSTINIDIFSGNIKGSIYGGSRNEGTIYGDVKINAYSGTINNIYGGGEGNNTYISKNIDIVFGNENYENLVLNNNIYGGSAYGTVHGTSTNKTNNNTNITINNGKIIGAVFGGAQGSSSYSPYVLGNINITVNGGIINDIYGGNDQSSSPLGNVNIYLKEGEITRVFGGGNKTNLPTTNIYLQGANTKTVFGGSNETGNVTTSNITLTDGIIGTIYGGNNIGGVTNTSNVDLNGGEVTNVYGGGNKTSLTESFIKLNGTTLINVYGGSNETGNVENSNITVEKGIIETIYGGNNIGGSTNISNIIVNGGNTTTIYGGGKLTDTITSNITINNSTITSIYGGGEEANIKTTNTIINNGNISNIFGGSNKSGTVDNSYITVKNGKITNLYGGNNTGGTTKISTININGANIESLYGGGNNAATTTTNININDGIITNLYGGGNDTNGLTTTSNVNLNNGTVSNVYGGGNKANTEIAVINQNGSTVTNLYGGGNQSGINTTNINLYQGNISNIFGGSNMSGEVLNTNINTYQAESTNSSIGLELKYSAVAVDPYWQDTNYSSVATIDVTIKNNTDEILNEFEGYIKLSDSKIYSNYNSIELTENNGVYTFNQNNIYDDNNPITIEPNSSYTFQFSIYSKLDPNEFNITEYKISGKDDNLNSEIKQLNVTNLYGGNNNGGITDNIIINLNKGTYDNIYGGGNKAIANTPVLKLENIVVNERVYGGGNQALVTNDTNVEIKNCTIKDSVFGGGNAGSVGKNTYLYISNSNIFESVYAGGNGSTAIVVGNTDLSIDGTTKITKHVFGGGNAANTGLEDLKNSKTEINIASATIGGNVYGGGNTSVVYGKTNVNIGKDTLTKQNLIIGNIIINGTVFGGGEANEHGDENYDYSFISVTDGTTLNIDGNNHDELTIKTSIFGSGNASSTEGYSYINISNYGTKEKYKSNISIQRADLVILDNSVIELIGTTDRTNEYSTVLFTLSRIKHLKLKNNSILYLDTGANLLEELTSSVDINGVETLQTVTFENNEIIQNVDNKIFIKGGKNLNIATNENATAYGRVNGMSFFGLYEKDRNGAMATGIYGNYKTGDIAANDDIYMFDAGSYVLGIHKTNHNTHIDGFYTTFVKDGIITVDYIKPTPDDSTYYMWSIGEQIVTLEMTLTASKYLTLGTEELGMLNYSDPNTTFSIVGFNYNDLNPNVNLIKEPDVPRIAASSTDADNNMSLVMKSTNSGWITKGQTTFLTSEESVNGTTLYKSENSTEVPTFQFYIYHSKNLGSSGKMGSVTISFIVVTPIDEISNDVQRVNLVVNLNRELYNTNDYEASMTNGKEYDLFASTNVNLTTNGSLSAYYSLFAQGNESIYKDGYHRSLVSTYVFPVNTKLTLINLNEDSVNEYYYYVVTEEDFNKKIQEFNSNKEASYDFNKFIRMGSISNNNNYNDEINNARYYDKTTNISHEEFIVIVDFADSNINENVLDKSLLIELRNADDKTVVSVLGIEQERMIYSLYTDSNAIVDVEGAITSNKIYPGNSVTLKVTTNFTRKLIDSEIIYDTNYFDQQLGVKITYLDSNQNQVTGASLLGVTYEYDGVIYYPRMDGSVRIKLAEKMANVQANIIINTTESVAAGDYSMVIESFGSSDGIYYGGVSSDTDTLSINILNTVYGLSLSMGDYLIIRDKETGNNLNDNNDLRFNLKYSSGLTNPKLRISLYRRNYDDIYSTKYEKVDFQEYVNETLTKTNKEYEYLLTDKPLSDITYSYKLKENLKTGTYKLVVSLYDNNTYIGDVYKYIIIKERYNE